MLHCLQKILSFLIFFCLILLTPLVITILLFQNKPLETYAQSTENQMYFAGQSRIYESSVFQLDNELTQLGEFVEMEEDNAGRGIGLTQSGQVYIWGNIQRGDGTTSFAGLTPYLASGTDTAIDVFLTLTTVGYVRNDGTVWTWGNASFSELGIAGATSLLIPTQITSLSGIVQVSGGNNFLLARNSSGEIFSWGRGTNGALGGGNQNTRSTPTLVSGISNVTFIETSALGSAQQTSYALVSGGTVYAWGGNLQGQVGNNSTAIRTTPLQVSGVTNVTQISAGISFVTALLTDGTLVTWGGSPNAATGNGLAATSRVPVGIPGISNVSLVRAGAVKTIIVLSNGTVMGTGLGAFGEFGSTFSDSNDYSVLSTYTTLPYIQSPKRVFVKDGRSVYIQTKSDTVVTNPFNSPSNGDQGKVNYNSSTSLNRVDLEYNFLMVEEFVLNFVGVTDDNRVFIWDYNGQFEAVEITGITDPIIELNIYQSLLGTQPTYLALTNKGEIWSWGSNFRGTLGRGSFDTDFYSNQPEKISTLSRIIDIDLSENATAVTESGEVYIWGYGNYSSIDINASNSEYSQSCSISDDLSTPITEHICSSPLQIPQLSNARQVIIGYDLAANQEDVVIIIIVLTKDGGIEHIDNFDNSFSLDSIDDVVKIDAEYDYDYKVGIALKQDGTILTWGENFSGERGLGLNWFDPNPEPIPGLNNVIDIAIGAERAIALTSSGIAYAWGGASFATGLNMGIDFNGYEPRQIVYGSPIIHLTESARAFISGEIFPPTVEFDFGSGDSCVDTVSSVTTQGTTVLCLRIQQGSLSLFAADSNDNNDVCTDTDNLTNRVVDTSLINQESTQVICSEFESGITITGLSVSPQRQIAISLMNDIVFEDLRGVRTGSYTINASIDNFVADNGTARIDLGSNPDGATEDNHPNAPLGDGNAELFAVIDCSSSIVTPLRDGRAVSEGLNNYTRGSSVTLTSTDQSALVVSALDVPPGRVDVDECIFKLRVPGFVRAGDYRSQITFTIT